MSGIAEDNEFLTELDLELMRELVDFHEKTEIVLEELPWEENSKKVA